MLGVSRTGLRATPSMAAISLSLWLTGSFEQLRRAKCCHAACCVFSRLVVNSTYSCCNFYVFVVLLYRWKTILPHVTPGSYFSRQRLIFREGIDMEKLGHTEPDSVAAGRDPQSPSSTIVSHAAAVARALASYGIDSASLLRTLGIDLRPGIDPSARVRSEIMGRFYLACVELTGDPYFGLTVARHADLVEMHALGMSIAASSTLWGMCERLERHFRLLTHAATMSLTASDGLAFVRIEHKVNIVGPTEDFFIGFLLLAMRKLYKTDFDPLRVELHRDMPIEGPEPYEALLRAPVSFANPASLLVFRHSDMVEPLRFACPDLAMVHDKIVIAYLARLDKDDIVTGVRHKIIELLPEGECDRDKVASALCMSPTTLQFKLSRRGASFNQLLDSTRKELACAYMRQAARSVTEITYLLGFSDTSNFTRAFKRWTGLSPRSFRLQ
jgi:AraC-like DNA-binding protein